ncbi:hypothetical protein RD792_006519 [Penstemon davidsonii]|uniref:Uncharacterized protein n=1 Tax=Penstemon davidsonii TaxID=160366 RepID=A0ABR0DD63_9LAMI|nr:hypothetical protein RD792_006519 [Penstemon davidsonii]
MNFENFPYFSPPPPSHYPPTPPITPPPHHPSPPPKLAPPPPKFPIPPPPSFKPPPPHIVPSPPHPISPPPPHIVPSPPNNPISPPLPPPPPGHHHHTVIVFVFVSIGGIFFLAFLAAAFFCFIKKKKKRIVQETDKIKIDEHMKVEEDIVQGPHGSKMVVLTIDEDVHIEEEIKKNEKLLLHHRPDSPNPAPRRAPKAEPNRNRKTTPPNPHCPPHRFPILQCFLAVLSAAKHETRFYGHSLTVYAETKHSHEAAEL